MKHILKRILSLDQDYLYTAWFVTNEWGTITSSLNKQEISLISIGIHDCDLCFQATFCLVGFKLGYHIEKNAPGAVREKYKRNEPT